MKNKNLFRILLLLFLSACGPAVVNIEPTPTAVDTLPDLTITSIVVSLVDSNGTCLPYYAVNVTVLNQSTVPASEVIIAETVTGQEVGLGTLAAWQSISMPFVAKSASGNYTVVVDPHNAIAESNETNNSASPHGATATPPASCPPPQWGDATPTLFYSPTPASQNLEGLIYADMSKAQTLKATPYNNYTVLMEGTDNHFSKDGLRAVFESLGDIFLAEPMDNPGVNITNTPDRLDLAPQLWDENPMKVVFNSMTIEESREQGWGPDSGILGIPSMVNADGSEYTILDDSPSYTRPALGPDAMTIAYDKLGAPMIYELGLGARPFDPTLYGYQPEAEAVFTSPSFSPDGLQLSWWVSSNQSQPDGKRALVIFDLAGKTARELHSYTSPPGACCWLPNPVWSPSGQWIAFQTIGESTAFEMWVVHQGGGIGQVFSLASNPVWSPNSERVAFVQSYPRTQNLPSTISVVQVPSWNVEQVSLPPGSIPLGWTK